MPKHLKKISEEILHKNPWWTYKHDIYEKPNGEEGEYFYAEFGGMAMVIPVLEDARIVLTLQHRYLADKQSIEFPGGGIASHADALETAKQELLEETGCIAHEFIKVGVFEPVIGYAKDASHIFVAHVQDITETSPDDTEEFDVLIRRPDEVDRMIQNNAIWHGQTLAAWALARGRLLS